jgi:type IV pilus assembly protein PilX
MSSLRRGACPAGIAQQRGIVIIVSLVILVTITIIAVTSMSTSGLEERMAANYRDREVAFQSAEAALRAGEREVATGISNAAFDLTCTNGLCKGYDCGVDTACTKYWLDASIWEDADTYRTYTASFSDLAAPGKYIIEYLGHIPESPRETTGVTGDPRMYRITAVGTGTSPHSRVMLQSTYRIE